MGQLCSIKSGKSDTKDAVENGAYAFFDRSRTIKRSSRYLYDCEALIIPGEGAEFLPRHFTGKFDLHQRTYALYGFSDRIDVRFLYHFLHHVRDYFPRVAVGATVKSLRLRHFEQLPVSLTSLPEQRRIVGILDEAFEGIATSKANTARNLQNARTLFESHLQSVFTQPGKGWVESELKALTTKIGSGATPRGGEASYKREGVSLIRSLNVHDLSFRYPKLAFLDDAQAEELSNVRVQRRDVLLNITGASVARCCIVPEDVLPARVNQHVSIIRPIADILDAGFLHYLLISKPYKDRLLQTGEEGGSTRQAITKGQIEDFSIICPATLNEQKSIAGKLDALLTETQRLELLYQQKLAALDALTKTLLHQAFTGQL